MKLTHVGLSFVAAVIGGGAMFLPSGICEEGGSKGETKPEPQIVKKIVKVEYVEEEINPPNLVVTATGEVPTAGYEKVNVVRMAYIMPPEDGIQDYILFAVPPAKPAAQIVTEVKASNRWKGYETEAAWIKGIRIYGVDDGAVVKMFEDSQ